MTQEAQAVVLFANTQTAIRAEHLFEAEGIRGKLIPIPREFASDCGLAFRFPAADVERVREALARAGVKYGKIHVMRDRGI